MRHNRKINHLGRQSGHRKAMMSNMASSLILHKRIETTVAKAKALKKYVEPLITKSKDDTTHSRRIVFSYLKDKFAVTELFRTIAPAVGNRPGGYTRILHTGFRLGDAAEMCIIELVDFNEGYKAGATPEAKGKTRRSRSAGTKKSETVVETAETGAGSVGETADAPATEKTSDKKAPAKKEAHAKATPGKAAPKGTVKPSVKATPKISAAKTKAVKTGVSKKS